ncbi:Beta-galactosidase BoGH2A [subsurface metagenome]
MIKLNIMKTIILLLLVVFMFDACSRQSMQTSRKRENFNAEWKFSKGDHENAYTVDFDDSKWREMDLPHDWAIEGPFTQEVGFKGGYLPYPGLGWYRKSFTVPTDTKNLLIEFDGIMRNSKIWLNGEYIGGWPYGYTSFAIDLTDKINREGENLMAVRVENQDSSSRWYPGSGIYRNVWLTYTNPVHVAHWGTYITSPEISAEKAIVDVRTILKNKNNSIAHVSLTTSIVNNNGTVLTTLKKEDISIEANQEIEIQQDLEIEHPVLWDIETPNLYKAVSSISLDGKIIDNYETPFGIRYFHFDPDKGFFLNGKPVKLQGVNLHHDLGPLGAAVNKRATERQLEIMKEMGVNAIRCAHNPPSPEQLDLCDQMGILVIDETFDEWSEAKYAVPNSYNLWFDEWAEKDTRALLKRDRNHPSIIMWSIGNEIPDLDTEAGKRNAKMLSDICREMDPTRPVNAGVHLTTQFDDELEKCFDVFGMNYWQDRYEMMHEKYPNLSLLSTESSATLSTRGEYHFPVEEIYRGYIHESKQITSYDLVNTGFGALPDVEFKLQEAHWMAGQFVWSGFDYHGEPDPYEHGYFPAHSSYFGIVDMCGFKKDRFYLYQSQWTEEPMVHLLPHWNWEGREGEITPVYAYSNCYSVELIVNGESKGKKVKEEGIYRFKWEDILYQPGSIKALGYDEKGNVLCEKEIKTAKPASKIELIPDRSTIQSDGEDLSFITVKITDAEGNLCPEAADFVQFTIEGEGTLACVGNGDPTCIESYQKSERSAFHGMCMLVVQSTNKTGEISITAQSENLEEASIQIKTEN